MLIRILHLWIAKLRLESNKLVLVTSNAKRLDSSPITRLDPSPITRLDSFLVVNHFFQTVVKTALLKLY